MKALVRYKYGTPPHAVMSGTDEELKAALAERFDFMEHNGFYFDKANPLSAPPLRKMFDGPYPKHDYYMILDADKWQNKLDTKKLPETDIKASGEKSFYGGAYVIAFIYSNRGNFVLKGYHNEVQQELDSMNGLKYFVNFSMWASGTHRDWWQVSGKGIYIREPDKSNKFKWTIYKYQDKIEQKLTFKRLPKRWIPEIEALTH
jgi:hypothetical protein